ncbi:MAG: hypothetical protein HYW50_03925 [Candidatus Diapherotrites archaeon]|nr:hypothetical protein [Candidatus Diapherotrites archaeon]
MTDSILKNWVFQKIKEKLLPGGIIRIVCPPEQGAMLAGLLGKTGFVSIRLRKMAQQDVVTIYDNFLFNLGQPPTIIIARKPRE